ncbi:Protein FAM71A [Heterocephalus glaber]|uniref:Protein FAM71A n=1 Tax=Heterocephalus glaber TaxID=10181 RepID=G5AKI3_HETGA|nr:Protein FAM71A [Heterocephalus glaber]
MVMNSKSLLPCYAVKGGSAASIFGTSMGKLQQQLRKGKYYMFRSAPMFESDFIQITKRGELIDVHNHMDLMTVGVACTSSYLPIPIPIPDVMLLAREATSCEQCHSQAPKRKKCKAEEPLELTRLLPLNSYLPIPIPIPDVMLLAREATSCEQCHSQAPKRKTRKEPLELTRLLPLKFVKISVHDSEKKQLRLKFTTGCSLYLQLCPPLDACEDLFTYWESLIHLLQSPFESISGTYATPAEDIPCLLELANADRASLAASDAHGRDAWDQVSIRSVHSDPELTGDTSDDKGRDAWDQVSIRSVHSDPELTGATSDDKGRDAWDQVSIRSVHSDPELTGDTSDDKGRDAWDQVSIRSVHSDPELTGDTSAAYSSGEGDQPSSRTSTAIPRVCTPEIRSAGSAEASARGTKREAAVASGMASVDSGQVNTALAEATFIGVGGSKSPMAGPGGAEARQQGAPQASKASRKKHRERKERSEDRPLSRSSYHRRTHEGRHKTEGDKMAQKSSSRSLLGHRTHRVNKNEEGGHLRAKSSSQGHSPKGISHTPLEKESRSSNKFRRSLFSSFLRNIRAKLGMKGAASLHGGDGDMVPKRVEETNLEVMVEMAEFGQGVEVGSVTSEVMKTSEDLFRSP